MPSSIRIAVDIMGGDLGPHLCVRTAQKFLSSHPQPRITLVGDADAIAACGPSPLPELALQVAADTVRADDKPSVALRHKQHSSMAEVVRQVAEGRAQACVSSGNTGALMAFGLHWLGTLPGMERPAICKAVPTRQGVCLLLDLGANIDCNPRHLQQFAQMGAALARLQGVAQPRIALLNVGAEAQKGGALQREAAQLIQALPDVHYRGFAEGGDIYRGIADVVVCDGFTGNVLLKASEGVAELLQDSLRQALTERWYTRVLGALLRPALRHWRRRFDPALYNGASLLGLNGVVVKSHGATSEAGFAAALAVAHEQALHGLVPSMTQSLAAARSSGLPFNHQE